MSSTRSRRKKHETARQDVSRVRIRRAGARQQRRPNAGAVHDGARQDSAEPAVGHVRAAPATARDRDQAGAPAGAAALHQGIRRLTVGRWLGLVALSFAALRLEARPGSRREWLRPGGGGGGPRGGAPPAPGGGAQPPARAPGRGGGGAPPRPAPPPPPPPPPPPR